MYKEYKCYMVETRGGKGIKLMSKGKNKRITFFFENENTSKIFQFNFASFLKTTKKKYNIISKKSKVSIIIGGELYKETDEDLIFNAEKGLKYVVE